MNRKVSILLILCGFAFAGAANASLVITGQLTGDPRSKNPDNLVVDVSVTVADATPNKASWIVDINSPLHPNAKLDQFDFNLNLGPGQTVSFSNFSPNNAPGAVWGASQPDTLQGSGNMQFGVGVNQGGGDPNPNAVTNSVNLTFDMTLSSGVFTAQMFTLAPFSSSNDNALSPSQMGAHLQSLTVFPGSDLSDSGVALGDYSTVPEPASIAIWSLLGLGGAGMALWRRRRAAGLVDASAGRGWTEENRAAIRTMIEQKCRS